MGVPPPNPLENKKIQTLPVVRVPRTAGREEWGLFAPKPPTRNNIPGPYQWAHRTPDTTQAETPQLPENILGSYKKEIYSIISDFPI